MTASLALQQAVFARLNGDAPLMALLSGIYDIADRAASYPYVTIGADTSDYAGTKTSNILSIQLRLEIWTTALGRTLCKTIEKELYRLLHRASFTVSGFTLIDCHYESSTSDIVQGDRLLRGTVLFRVTLQ